MRKQVYDLKPSDFGQLTVTAIRRTNGELRDVQPHVVTDAGQVRFWFGAFPPREGAIEESYERLGTTAERLFPLTYRALVEHDGARLEGTITCFVHGVLGSSETFELR